MVARIGILIYDRFKRLSEKIEFVRPMSARSKIRFKKSNKKVKGKKMKQEIANYINELFEIELDDFDLVDSLVLALNGLLCS